MSLQAKQPSEPQPKTQTALGLYVHVPFCASTCNFCAFYQEKPRRGDLDRYLAAMEMEFARLPAGRPVDTVFWGGGTPGLLAAKDLERLGRAMREALPAPPAEWTVEMAPSTVKANKLAVLRDLGVTRISMGVQSFRGELLESLGRLHRPNQIYEAWERVREAGFPRTNLDLMFAIPGQSLGQWEADLREAARLGPDHLSTYCLTFEEDTALYVKLSQGKVSIDEERELAFYERGRALLEELGYPQYEISNFARPGAQCIHNVNTWRMREWIGCGPSAASQFAGERWQRPSNLDRWAGALARGESPKEERVSLDDRTLFIDALVFGLRMNAGVSLGAVAESFPQSGAEAEAGRLFERFAKEGLLERDGDRVALTRRGRLVADAIGSALLEAL